MPVEPPPTAWTFPAPDSSSGDLVAVGADLAPGTLLAAYRRGLFPMPLDESVVRRVRGARLAQGVRPAPTLSWWAPERRGVLPLGSLRVTRSLRQSARLFSIRVDTAFAEVVGACADPARTGGWIDESIASAYEELHQLGWAHSVEAWHDGRLAGGLYGVAIGGLFAGESMFTRVRDASKVALLGLVDLLSDEYAGRRLLDTQWQTPHLATLGVQEMPRPEYLRHLGHALTLPPPAAFAG